MIWRERAACRGLDPEVFLYPETRGGAAAQSEARAKAVCRGCPVRKPCLAEADRIGADAAGIWGGLTEDERRERRERRKRKVRAA